jgi:AP-3 complex subunit delta-1
LFLQHARRSEGAYRDELIAKIMFMCRKEKYGLVSSFSWYTATLLELAVMQGSKHGAEVAEQLMEVSLRVDTVRPYAVEKMITMLLNDKLALGQARTTVCEVLKAAAWIVGEYSDVITMIACDDAPDDDDDEESNAYWIEDVNEEDIRSAYRGQNVHLLLVGALLHPRVTNLPPHVQMVFVQAAMKLFLRAVSDLEEENVAEILGTVRTRLPVFMQVCACSFLYCILCLITVPL